MIVVMMIFAVIASLGQSSRSLLCSALVAFATVENNTIATAHEY